jgi:Tfp pilus assembly protein PilE
MRRVARGVSLVSLLATLLVVGWLLIAQDGHSPTSSQTRQAVDEAQQAAAGLTFQQAQTQLEQAHALNGTYTGASVAGFGVMLVRADAASYCLQTGSGTALSHLTGPGGAAASGPC